MIGPWVQTSVYDIPTIDFHFRAVLTNLGSTVASGQPMFGKFKAAQQV